MFGIQENGTHMRKHIEVRIFQRILKDTNKLEFMQIHICDD